MNNIGNLQKAFQRDITYLRQNQLPLKPSGEKIDKLDYEADSDQEEMEVKDILTDDDVMALSQALINNDVFSGDLDLTGNDLTDLVSYHKINQSIVCPVPQGRNSQRGIKVLYEISVQEQPSDGNQERCLHWRCPYSK